MQPAFIQQVMKHFSKTALGQVTPARYWPESSVLDAWGVTVSSPGNKQLFFLGQEMEI